MLHSVYMYNDQQKYMLEVEFLNNGDTNLGPMRVGVIHAVVQGGPRLVVEKIMLCLQRKKSFC